MSGFTGTGMLARLYLRRDRVRVPIWVLAIFLLVVPSLATFPTLYKDQKAIDVRNELLATNPGGIALTGPAYGLDEATPDNLGPMAANEMSASTIIAVALMGIFLMVRNTRTEEQEGRLELLRAGVVGRYASVTAAFLVTSGASILLGVMMGAGMAAQGFPAAGSFAFALSMSTVAIAFAAVAALTAQLTEHSRGATGMAVVAFAAFFVIRTIGDIRENAIRWFSPIGWAQGVRPFADERWWMLLLPLAFAAVLIAAAFALIAHRDVGAGLLPTRKGHPRASAFLVRPMGLALRLQRGSLIAWAVGLFVFGAMIGSLAIEAQRMLEALDVYKDYFTTTAGANLVETFLAAYMSFIAMTAIGYALQSITQLRTEESKGRVEPLLAGSLSRTRWAASQIGATFIGSLIVLGAAGVGAGMTYSASIGDESQFLPVLGAMLAYLPAVWILVGLAVALSGAAPRAYGIVWIAFGWVVVIGMLGPLLGLPEWTADWTPFAHTPQLPAEQLTAAPLLVMTAIVVVLLTIGLAAFRRRDVEFG